LLMLSVSYTCYRHSPNLTAPGALSPDLNEYLEKGKRCCCGRVYFGPPAYVYLSRTGIDSFYGQPFTYVVKEPICSSACPFLLTPRPPAFCIAILGVL
jgi:hypothetical protein